MNILKRAEEIKEDRDRRSRRSWRNIHETGDMPDSWKEDIKDCIALAEAEERRIKPYMEKYGVIKSEAEKMAQFETLHDGATVSWRIWRKGGYNRAYYTISGRSAYQNNKKDNWINIR